MLGDWPKFCRPPPGPSWVCPPETGIFKGRPWPPGVFPFPGPADVGGAAPLAVRLPP